MSVRRISRPRSSNWGRSISRARYQAFDNLVAFGKLSSSIGSIQTDLIFGSNKDKNIAAYLRGRIASSNLRLHELFGENNPFGEARFDINIDTRRPVGGNFSGNIQAQVKEFDYKTYKYKGYKSFR